MEDEILICAFVSREWWETFVALPKRHFRCSGFFFWKWEETKTWDCNYGNFIPLLRKMYLDLLPNSWTWSSQKWRNWDAKKKLHLWILYCVTVPVKYFYHVSFAMIKRYFEHCTYPKMPSLVVLRHTKVPHGMLDELHSQSLYISQPNKKCSKETCVCFPILCKHLWRGVKWRFNGIESDNG